MEIGWDKLAVARLVEAGIPRKYAYLAIGEITEQRQKADREGYVRGYNEAYSKGVADYLLRIVHDKLILQAQNDGWTYRRLGSMCDEWKHPNLRRKDGGIHPLFTSDTRLIEFLENPGNHPDFYMEK